MANLPYFVAEYIHPSFRLDTPSPYSAGSPWGLLSRKIFYFFLNPLSTRSDYTLILFFQIFVLVIQYKLSFWLVTSFVRYLLVWFLLYFPRTCFDLFQHCRFYALTLQLFISSACYKQTSMLMQSLFYACFGYFKAFWRVFVCFRCSLSSLVKIMRQKA